MRPINEQVGFLRRKEESNVQLQKVRNKKPKDPAIRGVAQTKLGRTREIAGKNHEDTIEHCRERHGTQTPMC